MQRPHHGHNARARSGSMTDKVQDEISQIKPAWKRWHLRQEDSAHRQHSRDIIIYSLERIECASRSSNRQSNFLEGLPCGSGRHLEAWSRVSQKETDAPKRGPFDRAGGC